MKYINVKSIVIFSFSLLFFNSCSDALLNEPEVELGLYVLNEDDELVLPDTIVAGKTKVYFTNERSAFFSVVYSGEKMEMKTETREDGQTYTIWTYNYDYKDIDNSLYLDKNDKRAVTGLPLTYNGNYNKYLQSYKYKEAGEYKVYLEGTNTDEEGNILRSVTFLSVVVVEASSK